MSESGKRKAEGPGVDPGAEGCGLYAWSEQEVAMFLTKLGLERLVALLPVDGATLSTLSEEDLKAKINEDQVRLSTGAWRRATFAAQEALRPRAEAEAPSPGSHDFSSLAPHLFTAVPRSRPSRPSRPRSQP